MRGHQPRVRSVCLPGAKYVLLSPTRIHPDKGLLINYKARGGGYKMVGGGSEVLPIRKQGEGCRKSFSHAEEGAQQVLG